MPKLKEDLAVNKATLAENKQEDATDLVKAINVYNIPREWIDLIKGEGFSFTLYAKIAIKEKMKREGLLK